MNIIGLIEMHPFDGTDAFICLRVDNGAGGLFDLPITQDQLSIVTSNMTTQSSSVASEETEAETDIYADYEPGNNAFSNPDDSPLVLNSDTYTMGAQPMWDEDDDL